MDMYISDEEVMIVNRYEQLNNDIKVSVNHH
jgi:hypothetical protein